MPKKQPANLDEQLRQAIADSGLTHYSLARDAGISPSVLDRFMLPPSDPRRRDLRLVTAGKIAGVLGLSLR
jgi:hypothetical protein